MVEAGSATVIVEAVCEAGRAGLGHTKPTWSVLDFRGTYATVGVRKGWGREEQAG